METTEDFAPHLRNLGRAARFLRARRELSQDVLGRRAGLHRNYVGAIERGEINPTLRVMLKLTHGLDVPLSKLIEDFELLRREQQ
jgi:transcriptional regulator with XRE-family HTH domain